VLSQPASCSRRLECDVQEFGGRFPVLQALGDHTQGQRLHSGDRLVAVGAVAHHARESGHFGQPPAVVFAVKLDRESHPGTVPSGPAV
jgi:hypothetical protein